MAYFLCKIKQFYYSETFFILKKKKLNLYSGVKFKNGFPLSFRVKLNIQKFKRILKNHLIGLIFSRVREFIFLLTLTES